MNFLAHAVLSFENPDIMVGNFIADFIKGNDYMNYSEPVRKGILLHREIDHFTDRHPQVRLSKRRLYEPYHHYSGVIVDMYYDHFLAANFFKFHTTPLESFTQIVYKTVGQHGEQLPEKAENILHYMSKGNWLLNYAQIPGVEQALKGMARRTRFKSNMEYAGASLRSDYLSFYTEFMIFFPKVVAFAKEEIQRI
jgi:acyl carrier protein phosphodiesterase